jgi:hypothetical protein
VLEVYELIFLACGSITPQVLAESAFRKETNILPFTDGFCRKVGDLLRLDYPRGYKYKDLALYVAN